MQVIATAEAGHQDADLALRELAAEYISRREEMPTELANYVQRALMLPPVTYPPGRNIVDTWLRDVGIAVMVSLTMVRWELPASRSHSRKPASKRLSACYSGRPQQAGPCHPRAAGRAHLHQPQQARPTPVRINSPCLMRTANPGKCDKWGADSLRIGAPHA